MSDTEKVIKEYEDYVNGYECFCTSDDYEYEMHKAVLALLKKQQEQIDRLIEENASNAEMADGLKELLKEQEDVSNALVDQCDRVRRLRKELAEQPQIVRCKDCKFMYEDDVFQCAIKDGYFPVHEEWFCADGEVKE